VCLLCKSGCLFAFLCRWLKDGQLIDEQGGFKILLNGRKLVIAQAQVSDTGLYQCVATNTAGNHRKEFEVTVHGMLKKGQEHMF
jgi:hemicentin